MFYTDTMYIVHKELKKHPFFLNVIKKSLIFQKLCTKQEQYINSFDAYSLNLFELFCFFETFFLRVGILKVK